MNTEVRDAKLFATAEGLLDRLVQDFKDDERRWLESGKEPRFMSTDASEVAREMLDLIVEQPAIAAWLLAVAIQRLGNQ